MKKVIASVLSVAMVAAIAAGCNKTDPTTSESQQGGGESQQGGGDEVDPTDTEETQPQYGSGSEVINLWSFTNEIPNMVAKYIELNPEFGQKYTVKCTIVATDGGAYQQAIDQALAGGADVDTLFFHSFSHPLTYMNAHTQKLEELTF